MQVKDEMRILMVCLGNICRSPTAQGVMEALAQQANLPLEVDSAGTYGGHAGERPDSRSQQAARLRGYDLSGQRARQIQRQDFYRFDLICAMDTSNLRNIQQLCPADGTAELRLLGEYSQQWYGQPIPDPYYGGASGFDDVLNRVEDACRGIVERLQKGQAL